MQYAYSDAYSTAYSRRRFLGGKSFAVKRQDGDKFQHPSVLARCGTCETIAALQRAGVPSRGKTEGQLMEAFLKDAGRPGLRRIN